MGRYLTTVIITIVAVAFLTASVGPSIPPDWNGFALSLAFWFGWLCKPDIHTDND